MSPSEKRIDFARVPRRALYSLAQPGSVELVTTIADAQGIMAPSRRFRMHIYSGGVLAFAWFGDVYVELASVTLDKPKVPSLLSHEWKDIVGDIDGIEVGSRGVDVLGQIYDDSALANDVYGKLQRGFPWQASAWWMPGKIEEIAKGSTAQVNGITVQGPCRIWRNTKIKEGSFTPFGLDSETGVSNAADAGDLLDLTAAVEQGEQAMAKEEKIEVDVKAEVEKAVAARVEADAKRMADLKAAFPGREAFVLEQYGAGADVPTAKAAFADVLQKELDAVTKRAEDAEAKAAQKQDRPGVTFHAGDNDKAQAEAAKAAGKPEPTLEEKCKAAWAANTDGVRDKFNRFESFYHFTKAEANGQVGIVR